MNVLALVTGLCLLALYTIFSAVRRIQIGNAYRKREILYGLKIQDNHRKRFVGFFHPYW